MNVEKKVLASFLNERSDVAYSFEEGDALELITHTLRAKEKFNRADEIPGIENVTTEILDLALRTCGVSVDRNVLDLIIDLVEIIEVKGGEVNIMEILKIKEDQNERRETTQGEWRVRGTYPNSTMA